MVSKFSPKSFSQHQLTKIFIASAALPASEIARLRYKLWFNPSDDASLRLSLEGYKFVTQTLKITGYEFELDKPLTNRNLLQLERCFPSMYYLFKNTKIVVFEEQEASMLALHSNDLPKYLENLELIRIDENIQPPL